MISGFVRLIMTLHDIIKESLNGQVITGKDKKRYVVKVKGSAIFVTDFEDNSRYGWFPEIRDLGTQLLNGVVVDFRYVQGNGLYRRVLQMISEAVPASTTFRDEMANLEDRGVICAYVNEQYPHLDVKGALERTCLGHVLLASQFSDVKLYYRDLSKTEKEGVDAMLAFREDTLRGVYPTNSSTELYLIGTKPAIGETGIFFR